MKNSFEIIRADLSKTEHCAAYVSLIGEYREGPTGDGKSMDARTGKRLVKGVGNHPGARVYFAVCRGEIAGCATCFIGFSTFQGRKLINVHDLIVTKKFRRKGAARKLLRFIARRAKLEGLCKMTLEVLKNNKRALALYRSEGFGAGDNQTTYFLTKPIG